MKLREEEFYNEYHQHGGTTIIPTEIFNELYDDATEEIERLNKVLKYLEIYFSNRENYELAQIVRDTKEANIEWLDKAINRLKGIDLTEKDKRQIRGLKRDFKVGDKD